MIFHIYIQLDNNLLNLKNNSLLHLKLKHLNTHSKKIYIKDNN